MSKQHKHADLIKAWADGAKIQFRSKGEWLDVLSPCWINAYEYRVTPVKKWTPKYRLVVAEIGDNSSNSNYKDVSDDVKNYWKLTKFVEEFEKDWKLTKFVEEFEKDWDNQNYRLYKLPDGKYKACDGKHSYFSLGTLKMSKECAEKLCDMLNNKEIEL